MERIAAVSITRHGTALAARLAAGLPNVDHYVIARFQHLAPAARPVSGKMGPALGELFRSYDGLVCFFSLGATIRLLAPYIRDKKTDPALVVVDDQAQWAIAALSGHIGQANVLSHQVAGILGATPVLTTASDANQTIPVDILGRELGWRVDGWHFATPASAAVVNEEPVALYQDAGEPRREWWGDRPLPPGITPITHLAAAADPRFQAALIITDRVLDSEYDAVREKGVIYRPRTLAVGIGCNRGTPKAEIAQVVAAVLAGSGLSPFSIGALASIDRKSAEPGLLAYAEEQGLAIKFYSAAELNEVDVPNPSAAAMKYVGARGVAEGSAILAAGGGGLIVEKVKSGNCTVAVSRRRCTHSEGEDDQ